MIELVFIREGTRAATLRHEWLGFNPNSGWTIIGEVQEDYYRWVNDFDAHHPDYGRVYGDYEVALLADSREGLDHFMKHHPAEVWDYGDI